MSLISTCVTLTSIKEPEFWWRSKDHILVSRKHRSSVSYSGWQFLEILLFMMDVTSWSDWMGRIVNRKCLKTNSWTALWHGCIYSNAKRLLSVWGQKLKICKQHIICADRDCRSSCLMLAKSTTKGQGVLASLPMPFHFGMKCTTLPRFCGTVLSSVMFQRHFEFDSNFS